MTDAYDRIYRQLCLILQKVSESDKPIGPDVNLIEHLELDSMKVLDVVMEIEDELDVSVPLNTLVDVNTVSELAQLVSELEQQNK
jgi:acyl carrier protein